MDNEDLQGESKVEGFERRQQEGRDVHDEHDRQSIRIHAGARHLAFLAGLLVGVALTAAVFWLFWGMKA